MTMNHDTEYLQLCIRLIGHRLNWRPADEWRNYEFTELSEKILDATGVNLSSTTLKRVFGKLKYESLPSSSTLNTLAVFLGYQSWMAFKSKHSISKNEGSTAQIAKHNSLSKKKLWPVAFLSTAVIALLTFSLLSGKPGISLKNESEIVFKSKPLANGLPNSVVFNIDLKGNKPDKVVIQQSWDSTRTVKMAPGQKEATAIYYFPGYFRAKLILDGKIVKEHDLFIRSEKWMATIDYQPVPTYIRKEDLVVNEKMEVTENVVKEIRNNTTPTWLTYHLVRPFNGLQSGNFILESSIRNTLADGPAVCKTAKIFVLCSKGAFIIPFTIPGCIGSVNLKANDNYLEGRSHDLSSLGTDLTDWANVRVETKNKTMKIFLNNKLVREETYKEDAGEVVGLRFSFLGAGSVKNIKLYDDKGISFSIQPPV